MTAPITNPLSFFRTLIDSLDQALLHTLRERDCYMKLLQQINAKEWISFLPEHTREINLWHRHKSYKKDLLKSFTIIYNGSDRKTGKCELSSFEANQYYTVPEVKECIYGLEKRVLQLLKSRILIAEKVGLHKKNTGLPIFDPKRKKEILKRYEESLETDVHKFYPFFLFLHDFSVKIQEEVIAS